METVHLLLLSGGAWRGAFQYWVIVHLIARYAYVSIHGVSVGSINGVMTAMRKLEQLLAFWNELDGLKGYLSFRWLYVIGYLTGLVWIYEKLSGKSIIGGLYSMQPLFEKLKSHVRLKDLKTPFAAGVVSLNSGKYYTMDSRQMKKDIRLAKACLASSCMAPFMTPMEMHLEGETAEPEIPFDGGGRNIFPFPQEEIAKHRKEGKRVVLHLVACTPLQRIHRVKSKKVSGPFEIALRALGVLEAEVFDTDLLQLVDAVGPDGEVHIWAPQPLSDEELAEELKELEGTGLTPIEIPGESFDASKNTIQGRLRESKRMVRRGPVILTPPNARLTLQNLEDTSS